MYQQSIAINMRSNCQNGMSSVIFAIAIAIYFIDFYVELQVFVVLVVFSFVFNPNWYAFAYWILIPFSSFDHCTAPKEMIFTVALWPLKTIARWFTLHIQFVSISIGEKYGSQVWHSNRNVSFDKCQIEQEFEMNKNVPFIMHGSRWLFSWFDFLRNNKNYKNGIGSEKLARVTTDLQCPIAVRLSIVQVSDTETVLLGDDSAVLNQLKW